MAWCAPSSETEDAMSEALDHRQECPPDAGGDGVDYAATLLELAFSQHKLGRFPEAVRIYGRLLAFDPTHFDGLHLRGVALRQDADPIGALRWISRALRTAPGLPSVVHNLQLAAQSVLWFCDLFYREGRYAEFARLIDDALEFRACFDDGSIDLIGRMLHNAAMAALYERGDVALADACSERAVRLAWDPSILNFRMLVQLNQQNYSEAWNQNAWEAITGNLPGLWNGKPHDGTLVIVNKNGTGDFLQFMRFIPFARQRVKDIAIVLKGGIGTLVKDNPLLDGARIVSERPTGPNIVACETFSIPFALGLSEREIAITSPYLTIPADLHADWRRAVRRDDRLYVGIVWSSWAQPDPRSIEFAFYRRLFERFDAVFVGVHAYFSSDDLRQSDFPENFRFFGVSDLHDTACLLSAMDVVIAPDGGIAHLACALGIETWVLVTKNCDWRWRQEGEKSIWYDNARILRQPTQGDWEAVWNMVNDRLAARAAPRCEHRDPTVEI